MDSKISKLILTKYNYLDWAILLFGTIFLVFLVIVSYSVRPCSDDIYFYSEFLDKGWFFSIWQMGTNIRFTGFLVFNTLCLLVGDFQDFPIIFFVFYLLLFSFLLFSTHQLIKTILTYFFQAENVPFLKFLNLSLLFISVFYFSTINAQEVWFWTIATSIYLLPIPLIFLSISELIRFKSKWSYLTVGILFFLIGGMVENLVLTFISLLLLVVLFNWLKSRKVDWRIPILIPSMLVLPLLSVFHSGLGKRIKNEAYYSVENGFFKSLYSDYVLGLNYNRLIIILFILILVFYTANSLRTYVIQPFWNLKKTIVLSIIILILSFLTTFIPMFSVYGNFGPARASLPFFFVLIVITIFWTFILGLKYHIKNIYFIPVSIVVNLMIGIFTFNQQIKTSQFALEYDNRVKEIKMKKLYKGSFLVAKPLPDSGVIPSQELNKFGETPAMTSYYLGRVNGINKDIYLDTSFLKR